MFHFNISILIVLVLSDICFSCGHSKDDKNPNEYNPNKYDLNVYNPIEHYTGYSYGHVDAGPSHNQEALNDETYNDPVELDAGPSRNQEALNAGPSHNQEALNVGPLNYQEALNARTICINNIHLVFAKNVHPNTYINKALERMILFGEHKYNYEYHVKMYYYSFQYFVNVDHIRDTKNFSTKTTILKPSNKAIFEYDMENHSAIQFFEDEMTYDNLLPNYSPIDLQQLYSSMGFPYDRSEVTILPDGSPAHAVQLTIFKNALFYHKNGMHTDNDNVNDDTMKYFHQSRTYGYLYMLHIKRIITLITNIDSPKKFCKKLYPIQPPM